MKMHNPTVGEINFGKLHVHCLRYQNVSKKLLYFIVRNRSSNRRTAMLSGDRQSVLCLRNKMPSTNLMLS